MKSSKATFAFYQLYYGYVSKRSVSRLQRVIITGQINNLCCCVSCTAVRQRRK